MIDETAFEIHKQNGASKVILLAIIVAIFLTFFVTSHQVGYSVFSEEYVAGITHGDITRRIAFVTFGLFFLLLFILKGHFKIALGGLNGLIVGVYIVWSIASVNWAFDPQLVRRRIILSVILWFSALVTSQVVPLRQFPSIVMWVSALFLAAGIMSEVAFGTFSLSFEGYRFSGTCHPESQGYICALLLLSAAFLMRGSRGTARGVYLIALVSGFFFLLLTRSRGPFVAVIIALFVYRIYTTDRRKMRVYLFIAMLVVCAGVLILSEAFISVVGGGLMLGRQEDDFGQLNGRVPLWEECIEYINERPWRGYGYQGFWTEDRVLEFSETEGWLINSSHSMYVETVLSLGLVGLVIFMAMVMAGWLKARGLYLRTDDLGFMYSLCLLTLWMADGVLSAVGVTAGYSLFLAYVTLFGIAREKVSWNRS